MATFVKAFKILVVIGIVQVVFSFLIFFGGCRCNNPIIPYNLDSLSIANINNFDNRNVLDSNSMYSAEVAFSIMLADSNFYYPYYFSKSSQPVALGFSAAHATSMDCDPIFIANQKIVGINIVTLYSINSAIQSGTDVTSLFLARLSNRYDEFMYSTFENIFVMLNSQPNNQPILSFSVFLKVPVVNTVARFVFVISMSNGTVLTDTTNLITIIPNV